MKVARERKSSVLASNAVHHRIDSLTSLVALFTIGGTYMFRDALWLDPIGGLLISMMVVRAGWGNTKASLLELADTAIDSEVRSSVQDVTLKALAKNKNYTSIQVRDVQGMKSGQNYLFDVEVAVPGNWSVGQTRGVEDLVRQAIGANVLGAKRLKVRFVPLEAADSTFSEEFISPELRAKAQDHDHHEDEDEYDHDHGYQNGHVNGHKSSSSRKKK